ncbi:MAG: tetratricopeptide repeat protein [Desulfobacterales bacterium]|nr:MAG: tetratricopeptide repeat protein [Desulfobacterales bacterium]
MTTKRKGIAIACLLSMALAGCMKAMPPEKPVPPAETVEPEEPAPPSPRMVASLQLTEQGRRLLEQGKADNAIRVLEQAISLYPDNGQNYYYLAEAWLKKGVVSEAKKFNQLAEMHLRDDTEWMNRVAQQANRIADIER